MPPEAEKLSSAASIPSTASDSFRSARRRRWRSDILSVEILDIASAFESDGVSRPDIFWSPDVESCTTPQTRFLLEHWHALANETSCPTVQSIDPIAFAPALGYVHLVEPLSCGEEFIYRIFGTSVSGLSGGDFSGRRMSDMQASDYVIDFGMASCAAACERKRPLLTRRRPARAELTAYWERLLLPFVGEGGNVERLLIGIVPVSSRGDVIAARRTL